MDLSGALGGDFFAVGGAEVLDNSLNSGSGTVAATRANIGALTGRDYILEMTGGGWELRDSLTGAAVPMTGTGTAADPFVVDGLEIEVGGAADVGDTFLIRPTRGAVVNMDVLISDPSRIAAAAPIRTGADAGNSGSGAISAGEVLDSTNAQLRTSVTIEFTSANTYSINGAGSFPYTAGDDIDVNGWRVQISGAPAVGDSFHRQRQHVRHGRQPQCAAARGRIEVSGAQRRHDFPQLGCRRVRRRQSASPRARRRSIAMRRASCTKRALLRRKQCPA